MLLSVQALNTGKYGNILDVWYVDEDHDCIKRTFDSTHTSSIKYLDSEMERLKRIQIIQLIEPIRVKNSLHSLLGRLRNYFLQTLKWR
jgi:hypothetical protein